MWANHTIVPVVISSSSLLHTGIYWSHIPDLLLCYNSVIVPVVEYCCPAWHTSLTKEQSHHIESIQKRAFSIIFSMSLRGIYSDFCIVNNLDTLPTDENLFVKGFLADLLFLNLAAFTPYFWNKMIVPLLTNSHITRRGS